jgi:hypothetical protein
MKAMAAIRAVMLTSFFPSSHNGHATGHVEAGQEACLCCAAGFVAEIAPAIAHSTARLAAALRMCDRDPASVRLAAAPRGRLQFSWTLASQG